MAYIPSLISRSRIERFSAKGILSENSWKYCGVVNSVMVSHAGDAAVSGVSLVNTMDGMLIIFFTALVTGGAVVLSQAVGKGDIPLR